MGACIIPGSVRILRPDLCYRELADDHAISPIIMSCRANDHSPDIELVRQLIGEMYALDPAWLNGGHADQG